MLRPVVTSRVLPITNADTAFSTKPQLVTKMQLEDRTKPYQLPPDIDQRVQSQIALGIYQTPAEVLNEALDALAARRKFAETESVDLSSREINESQAADLGQRLKSFADDWDRPEMDVYDAI